MKLLIIFLIILIILSVAVVFLPIMISVRIVNKDIYFKLWNLPYIRKKKKKETTKSYTTKQKVEFKDFKNRLDVARGLFKETKEQLKVLLYRFKKTGYCRYYRSVITLGLDDPMYTGMSVGLTGAFFTEINSWLWNFLQPTKESYLSAVPNFNKSGLNFVTEFQISINVFNVLIFLKAISKYKNEHYDKIKIIFGGK
ncbi:MAG: DUF2953 domain-containing protein [Eubacteriales bacterium]|nr:DUF2953 domain-containing protein [Eubacteriales bacterium]